MDHKPEEFEMAQESDYWSKWQRRRSSRRGVLGAGITTSAGMLALGLVGCGDDDDENTPASGSGTGTTAAGGGTASALPDHPFYKGFPNGKRGGKFQFAQSDDPVGADPHSHEEPGTQSLVQPIYNGLMFPWENKPGEQEVKGELVEKWEQPNDTEFVLTLRKGVKYQNTDPVNGREFTAADVKYNLTRMVDKRPENRVRGIRADLVHRNTGRLHRANQAVPALRAHADQPRLHMGLNDPARDS